MKQPGARTLSYLVFLLVGLALLAGAQGKQPNWAEAVIFADPNLEQAVREAIDKPTGEIHYSDLQWLQHLLAHNSGISELRGLEYCDQLVFLLLRSNQGRDVRPLASLAGLNELSLDGNQLTDISPLAGLPRLRTLRLSSSLISDLYPLVLKPGLDPGDKVEVEQNPLSVDSLKLLLPELEERAVHVLHNCT